MNLRSRFVFSTVALLFAMSSLPSTAIASPFTVGPLPGNDCPADPACVANETGTYDDGTPGSPWIIKFNFNDDGSIGVVEINSLFPTIDGSEFTFPSTPSGLWSYVAGAGDPVVRFWVAKGGPNYNLFYDDAAGVGGLGTADPVTGGFYTTPVNPANGRLYGLSHLSFYDSGDTRDLPEPTAMLLLGTAAAASTWRLRRQRR